MMTTRLPISERAAARLTSTVDLPSSGLALVTRMVLMPFSMFRNWMLVRRDLYPSTAGRLGRLK